MEPQCPAALSVAGAVPSLGGVVCRVMTEEEKRTDEIEEGRTQGKFLSLRADPSTVLGFCCGTDLPVLDEPREGVANHSCCPVWRAETEKQLASRRRLSPAAERPAVTPFGMKPRAGGPRAPEEGFDAPVAELDELAEED